MKYSRNTGIVILLLMPLSLVFAQGQSHQNDFYFYPGEWEVQNERQLDDGTWQTFPATVQVFKTLNGSGNVDFFKATIDGERYEGMTIRQYDAANDVWQIRWYDSDDPMAEPIPSVGRFTEGEGLFYKTIKTESGHEVKVRFYWYDISPDSFRWESAWSLDGETWNPTWKMVFERPD